MVTVSWTSYNIKWINLVVTKLISLHQTVSQTEATLLLRNSAEIDVKGHTNIENRDKVEIKFGR